MSGANREPEYRRRIREKAEKDQQTSEAEWYKSSNEHNVDKITAAIKRVEQELGRTNDEHTPQKKTDRYWERFGFLGLWFAGIVGVAAICVGTRDAGDQRTVMENQLRAMRGQLSEMQVASQDAKRAIEATNRLGIAAEAGQRAFVTFAGLEAFAFASPDDPSLRWNVSPRVENSGNTPTRDLKAKAITCYRKDDLPRDFSFPDLPSETVPIDLGPKQITAIKGFEIPSIALPELEAGRLKIYVYGWATYIDIIRGSTDPHKTRFCYLINGFVGGANDPHSRIGHTLCWTHNCIDSECDRQDKERPPATANFAQVKESCKLSLVVQQK